MNPRSTGILFVVALMVLGLVYWNEFSRKEDVRAADEAAKRLFTDIDQTDLEWIALRTTDGNQTRLENRDGSWSLSEPLVFPADAVIVGGMASGLADLTSEGVIDAPQSADVYGLGSSAFVVRFGAKGEEHRLRLGRATPVGSNTYAAADDGEAVYTIPTFRAAAMKRSVEDLREKRVLRFDRNAIEGIELAWPGGNVELRKGEEGWRMTAPLEDAADETAVDTLLSDLSFLRAEGFWDDPPDAATAGLEPPAFTAVLTTAAEGEAAPQNFRIAIGALLEDDRRAARGAEPSLYRIPGDRLDDLPRTTGAYRFKQIARFEAADAGRLELAFHEDDAGQSLVVVADRDDAGWASSPEAIAPGKTSRMITELARLDGSDIVADSMPEEKLAEAGLSPARVVLRVLGNGDDQEVLAEVHLGSLDADRGIIARAADSDRVYWLDYSLAEHLPVNLEAFRNRFISKEDEAEAGELPPGHP